MGIGFGRSLIASALIFGLSAGALAAQDQVQSLFREGVRLLRQGRDKEALEKFKAVLAQDPTNDVVYNLWRRTEESVWARMLLKRGEFEKVAKALIAKATVERKRRMADPAAIKALVAKALSEDFPTRREACLKLAQEHGEYAVPALLEPLGDPDNEDGQIYAQQALVEIGPAVTFPLLAALKSDNVTLRRNILIVLRRLEDKRAIPAIKVLAARDKDALVKKIAQADLAKLGNPKAPAESLYVDQAQRMRNEDANIIGTFEQGDLIWSWKNGKLAYRKVLPLVYPVEMARQTAYRALAVNPAFKPAQVEVVLDYMTERTAVAQEILAGNSSPALAALNNALLASDVVMSAAGLDVVRQATLAAMKQGDAPLCRTAFGVLASLESAQTLPTSPLIKALDHNNSLVRTEAAIEIAKLDPQGDFPGAPKVAALLAQAADTRLVRLVHTIGLPDTARSVADAVGRKSEFSVVQASTGGEGLNQAFSAPADVFVIYSDLPQMPAIQVINQLRRNPMTKDKKIILVAKDVKQAAREIPKGKVDAIVSEAAIAKNFQAEILKVLKGFQVNLGRKRAVQLAREAAQAIAQVDPNRFALGKVEGTLAKATDHEENQVVLGVLRALGRVGGPDCLKGVAALVLDTRRPLEVRTEAARTLGQIFTRTGKAPAALVKKLIALVASKENLKLRAAVAGALGQANLSAAQRVKLLETLRLEPAIQAGEGE